MKNVTNAMGLGGKNHDNDMNQDVNSMTLWVW